MNIGTTWFNVLSAWKTQGCILTLVCQLKSCDQSAADWFVSSRAKTWMLACIVEEEAYEEVEEEAPKDEAEIQVESVFWNIGLVHGSIIVKMRHNVATIDLSEIGFSFRRTESCTDNMDTDSGTTSSKVDHQTKKIALLLVGAPGSGKSTFCDKVMLSASRPWVRVCQEKQTDTWDLSVYRVLDVILQDTIANGKAGTKVQCIKSAVGALKEGKSVFIDRCNLDREQRGEFTKLSSCDAEVHAVVLDLPAKLCIARSVKRTGHEGNLQGGKAAAVVNKMLQKKELPKLSEGYSRITFCSTENDVEEAIKIYSALGPRDTLQSGCFGQKGPDSKVQAGIMKFLKKVETPANSTSHAKNSTSSEISADNSLCDNESEKVSSSCNDDVKGIGKDEEMAEGTNHGVASLSNIPTLAFPSISTADFQFNIELASDIIVEKVEEYVNKLGEVKLVLVDISHGSKILSLVNLKAARKRIDSSKFTTFVGDITKLYSEGQLRCNVIANAANWRLRPGGGGVNAAIFKAAGPELETATKERAKSINPGTAVAVPLPSTSLLFRREGVTHVIHVLGPNMNLQRPNCLKNNYHEGCKVLQDTYSALFEAFASLVKNEEKFLNEDNTSGKPELAESLDGKLKDHAPKNDQKVKRESTHESEKTKKCKGSQDGTGSDGQSNLRSDRICGGTSKTWGSWAQALYHMAMDPERHKNDVLEITNEFVVVNDLYPKAKRHILVLARKKGLDCLADVREEDLVLLRKMHAKGLEWIQMFLLEDESLIFRLGYHSVPSMRQLHLHVISQDFDSKHLKNKKHWNSFNSAFFHDSFDVIHEVSTKGRVILEDDEQLLSKELRCHRCQSAHPNLPRLKSHIGNCRTPFPPFLQDNGRLVHAPTK
ncbi:Aprataxin, C2HE/C2H2/C2HC zinc finger [Dillenia turbinata]|uniref:Aprataxin, C2HE/C2H2/C2HC zinc finger n=1 Tax=Dillenia turbinata TaxID=194707 RepID=A0AAN8W7T1_9MAGN